MNFGRASRWATASRGCETRFLGDPARGRRVLADEAALLDAGAALKAGLVTFAPDDIDWDDEVRIAIEERASLSPDA